MAKRRVYIRDRKGRFASKASYRKQVGTYTHANPQHRSGTYYAPLRASFGKVKASPARVKRAKRVLRAAGSEFRRRSG
jgi:hypothetical protein